MSRESGEDGDSDDDEENGEQEEEEDEDARNIVSDQEGDQKEDDQGGDDDEIMEETRSKIKEDDPERERRRPPRGARGPHTSPGARGVSPAHSSRPADSTSERRYASQRSLRTRTDSENGAENTKSSGRPGRKQHYSDEELEEEEVTGPSTSRRKKARKTEPTYSNSDSEGGKLPLKEGSDSESIAPSASGDFGSLSKGQAARPQRSTRGPLKEQPIRSSDSEESLRRDTSSKGDLSRFPASRTRSLDSAISVGDSKSAEERRADETPTTVQSREPTSPEIDMDDTPPDTETEPKDVPRRSSTTERANPMEIVEKEEDPAGEDNQSSVVTERRALLPPRGPKPDSVKAKVGRIGKGVRKPTARALARFKKAHSDSEASNDDGYHSDASVSSNHSGMTRYVRRCYLSLFHPHTHLFFFLFRKVQWTSPPPEGER